MSFTENLEAPQLVLSGEIDVMVADQLRAAGEEVAKRISAGGRVEIDLSAVTFIDSSGLGALVAIRNHVRDAQGSVALVNLSPTIARVIELAGLRDSFLS